MNDTLQIAGSKNRKRCAVWGEQKQVMLLAARV